MEISPIGVFRSPFTSKFGLPRQSGIISHLPGSIVLTGDYARAEALRGLDEYDFLWIIWGFSENVHATKRATVRPPLLGGNERMGVWATRSPFRPNNLGLSSVRITRVKADEGIIEVEGADLMDGTPVYDIKPYLPYADCHPEARGGFTDRQQWHRLQVELHQDLICLLDEKQREVLIEALALDPRPHYHDDPEREYGMAFAGNNVVFTVDGDMLKVKRIDPIRPSGQDGCARDTCGSREQSHHSTSEATED